MIKKKRRGQKLGDGEELNRALVEVAASMSSIKERTYLIGVCRLVEKKKGKEREFKENKKKIKGVKVEKKEKKRNGEHVGMKGSLTATSSTSSRCRANLATNRPSLPKPLMPIVTWPMIVREKREQTAERERYSQNGGTAGVDNGAGGIGDGGGVAGGADTTGGGAVVVGAGGVSGAGFEEENRFEERTNGRGLLIRDWAPQVLIVAPGCGGVFDTLRVEFDTGRGVCRCADANVADVLDIGISVGAQGVRPLFEEDKCKELVEREAIKDAVEKVMGERIHGEERRKRARVLGEMAKKAIEEGGSSYLNMRLLIQDVMKLVNHKDSTQKHSRS
ncbi:hypothetical protein HYC85_022526 [Camellia sinensis]|uniref:Uncharacterized protein n=1 Tax=Camellia sinensis TaxID=4442 RepID=A0A7J7GKM4_CAMSI|nr:hypothetical protein HYC85_022526 [Camellia sinensis]